MERLKRIQSIFGDLQSRTEQRKIECTVSFKRYLGNFEQWVDRTLQTLQSGEIVTTDILQFEDNLRVSVTILQLTQKYFYYEWSEKHLGRISLFSFIYVFKIHFFNGSGLKKSVNITIKIDVLFII